MPAHPQRPRPSPTPPVSIPFARLTRPGLLASACAVLLLAGLAAPPAEAGNVKGKVQFGQRQITAHRDAGFKVSIRIGDRDRRHAKGHDHQRRGHRDWDHGRKGKHHVRESGHHRRHIDHRRCGGYFKQVRTAPVYHTRYDACGRPYRVLVHRGGYKRVWVAQCRHGLTTCR